MLRECVSMSCCSGQQLVLENEYPQDQSCNIHLRGGGGGGRGEGGEGERKEENGVMGMG